MSMGPIIDTQVWAVSEGNENLNIKGGNMWKNMVIDLRFACAVEEAMESGDEDFPTDGLTVVHFNNGRAYTVNIPYEDLKDIFIKIKTEVYAGSE